MSMRILIVAGGTGGHLFPAIRLAEEIKRQRLGEVLFVTTSRMQEETILRQKNITFSTLPVIPLQSKNILAILNFALRLVSGSIKSLFLLLRFRPGVAIGFGGYVSGPILLLASFSRTKTFIHEQNVFPGKTNRILARFVDKIAVSFRETKAYLKKFESKIIISGNPIRRELKRTENVKDAFTILAMGGSQGASSLNNLIPEAVGLINGDKKDTLGVIHIAGREDKDKVTTAYKEKGVENRVFSFTEDMGKLYSECDFVISRAGATTVSELLFLAKPSILIPYPYAGGHQRLNAKILKDKGIAVLLEEQDLTPEILRNAIEVFLDKARLSRISKKAGTVDNQDACSILLNEIQKPLVPCPDPGSGQGK